MTFYDILVVGEGQLLLLPAELDSWNQRLGFYTRFCASACKSPAHEVYPTICGFYFPRYNLVLNYKNFVFQSSRARAYACIREWNLARADYKTILSYQPGHPLALQGLEDTKDTVILLPMLGDTLLDNES